MTQPLGMTVAPSSAPPSVLVVDDNPVTRYATARVMRSAGFAVLEADSGGKALALAHPGLAALILDVNLPDIDGFEVSRALRARPDTARLPIIHLSATYIHDRDKVRGLDAGADAYVTHPADPALLVATVHALGRARIAEEALHRSEARIRAIYEHAPSGVCLIDADGRFTDANPAMLALLKRPRETVVGRKVVDFARSEDAGRMARYLARRGEATSRGDFALLDADGRAVRLEWSLSTHVEPGLSIAIVTDISELVDLSQQREQLLEREQAARTVAERMSRSKDELIAVLSHELRTPLNAILGWVHVLKRMAVGGPSVRAIDGIERSARAQARLVSDILDVSRMDLGKLRLDLGQVDLAELVRSGLESFQDAVAEKQLQVDFAAPASGRSIVADRERVQQVVWNLLSNAIKFSQPSGRVRIALDEEPQGVLLSVTDEGQGIALDFLPHLFERFTQSDTGSNRFHGGLGLGLSIVQRLVELHGGSVGASSEGPGRGAVFTVRLPWSASVSDGSEAAPPSAAALGEVDAVAPGALSGLTIAVVEDDADARELLGMVLRDGGARVVDAADYGAGLALLGPTCPDVLVSDIGLPGKDGYDLMREVRRREAEVGTSPGMAAIALTAFAREQDRQLAFEAGFDAFCAKPLRPHELISAILGLVRPRSSARAD